MTGLIGAAVAAVLAKMLPELIERGIEALAGRAAAAADEYREKRKEGRLDEAIAGGDLRALNDVMCGR